MGGSRTSWMAATALVFALVSAQHIIRNPYTDQPWTEIELPKTAPTDNQPGQIVTLEFDQIAVSEEDIEYVDSQSPIPMFQNEFLQTFVDCRDCQFMTENYHSGRDTHTGHYKLYLNFTTSRDPRTPEQLLLNGYPFDFARKGSMKGAIKYAYPALAVPSHITYDEALRPGSLEWHPTVYITDSVAYAYDDSSIDGIWREDDGTEPITRRRVNIEFQILAIDDQPQLVRPVSLEIVERPGEKTDLRWVHQQPGSHHGEPNLWDVCDDTALYMDRLMARGRLLESLTSLGMRPEPGLSRRAPKMEKDLCNPARYMLNVYPELSLLFKSLGRVIEQSKPELSCSKDTSGGPIACTKEPRSFRDYEPCRNCHAAHPRVYGQQMKRFESHARDAIRKFILVIESLGIVLVTVWLLACVGMMCAARFTRKEVTGRIRLDGSEGEAVAEQIAEAGAEKVV